MPEAGPRKLEEGMGSATGVIQLPSPSAALEVEVQSEGAPDPTPPGSAEERGFEAQKRIILHEELVRELKEIVKKLAQGISEDTEGRRKLNKPIFWLVASWLAATMLLLAIQPALKHPLSDDVQLALLGSLSLSVVGLLTTVVVYYFTGKQMVQEVMNIFFTKVLEAQKPTKPED